jgi:hypothetical protein
MDILFEATQIVENQHLSAVRIMMSGRNRDFKFEKSGLLSGNVAEFVAKIEFALTVFNIGKE